MKKCVVLIAFLLSLTSFTILAAKDHSPGHARTYSDAAHKETLYFFYSTNCPHCVAAHPFIEKLKAENPWLQVREYEISGNPRNSQLFDKMAKERGKETSFVPTFFIGNKMIVGYTSEDSTGTEIRDAVNTLRQKQ